MLKGAEGQAACTALAQSLAACSSLQTLHLSGECGKYLEGIGVLMRDAPVSVCLPPHLHRTCVCGTARVCVCVCVCLDVCVCCMCITRYLSIRVSTPLFIRPCVSWAHLCFVQSVCVWHCACVCICVCLDVCVCIVHVMCTTRNLSIFMSTPFFIRPCVSRVHLCVVQIVRAASNSKTNYICVWCISVCCAGCGSSKQQQHQLRAAWAPRPPQEIGF